MPSEPAIYQDPAVWTGADMAERDDWILRLSAETVGELGLAASALAAQIDGNPSALRDRPLAVAAGGVVEALAHDIRGRLGSGFGFTLVRGLPVADWEPLTALAAYWLLGSAIGRPLPNNPAGDMVGHVVDLGKDLDHPQHRAYQTNASMYFHVDQCDAVGLLCLRQARSGGESKVASSLHAHNVMQQRAPELARTLAEPLRWSRMGEVGPDQQPWYPAPVFAEVDGRLSVSGGVKHIEKGHALPGAPALSSDTREAMEYLNDLCEEFHLAMAFEPGDMQFLNNAVCMHARTGYVDWPEPERRRLLWRLWLNVDGLRPRSPFFQNWQQGIWAPESERRIHLEPAL